MYAQQQLIKVIGLCVLVCSFSTSATEFEITPFFGQMYSPDLTSIDEVSDISVDTGSNFGIAVAWQDSPNGQGQIMLNAVSHDFESDVDNNDYSLDIIYAHFNGIAQFRQQHYVTTVSIGLGGAYFDSEGGAELFPSATVAVGTRYEFSDRISFVTEVRGIASVVDNEDNIFCQAEICHAQFDDSLWVETTVSVGLAIKF